MAKKDINKDKEKNKNFGKELKSELKKVTWPTFKELVNSTSAVISIIIIVAIIVFILDVCFENLNKFGVERLKSLVASDAEVSEETDEQSVDLNDAIELVDSSEEEITDNEEIISEEQTDNSSSEISEEEVNQ